MIRVSECRVCDTVTLNGKGNTCACGSQFARSKRMRNGARATNSTYARFRSAPKSAVPHVPPYGNYFTSHTEEQRGASCAVVRRKEDGRILVVWSAEHGAWALPGDKWQPGDANSLGTMYRALREQCGVEIRMSEQIRPWPMDAWGMIASFEVSSFHGTPMGLDASRPVTWMTAEEFLPTKHPLQGLYAKMLSLAPVRRPS
jgi:hypothetical protein